MNCIFGGSITYDQENLSEQIVSLIATKLTTNDVATKIGNELDAVNTNSVSQSITGIISALAGLVGGGMCAAFLIAFAPALVIICCLCLCCRGGGGKSSSPAPAPAKTSIGKKR
jgi:hypothetical protein